ncbi:MAG: MBL fold metallo-hydrolase, partial [Planctomycetota bacterium]
MPTRIAVLVNDTTALPDLSVEHGLALWVEHDGHAVLFDAGTSGRVLLDNARGLGVGLEHAEAVCLSHGHYDHTGGLPAALPLLEGASLYAHPAVFTPKLARRRGAWQSIGCALSREEVEAAGLEVSLSAEPQEVVPGAVLLGEVERDPALVPATPHLFLEDEAGRRVDPFPDDQALALETEGGIVVVSGCAHAGIINHCRAAQRRFPARPLRGVLGGFHLVGASRDLLDATLAAFRDLTPQAIHPCHCTGGPATQALL